MKNMLMALAMMQSWTHVDSRTVKHIHGGNSYPINNNRGHAAKQKRQAKKRKNK